MANGLEFKSIINLELIIKLLLLSWKLNLILYVYKNHGLNPNLFLL